MRRRQAPQTASTKDLDEEVPSTTFDEIAHNDNGLVTKSRQKGRTINRVKAVRAIGLLSAVACFLLWTSFLPLPLPTHRLFRHAAARLLSAPPSKSKVSSMSGRVVFMMPIMTTNNSVEPADTFFSREVFLKDIGRPKFNGLVISPMPAHAIARAIHFQDSLRYETERHALLHDIDGGHQRERAMHYEDYAPEHRECRRNNWRDKQYPNCLTFHETSVMDRSPMIHDFDIQYTGHGYFRDSWMYGQHGDEGFVLKKLRLRDSFAFDEGIMYQIHREAIVMERLTGSPTIVNIYGHCATSIMSEPMLHEVTNDIIPNSKDDESVGYMKQADLDKLQVHDVHPMNNLTNMQKLDLAIVMTESIAEIHGYQGGVIIHGDIHPFQWLSNDKGLVKLNDFNNGEILEFNVEKNEYCKIYRCYGGTYRSPEEFRCMDSNEGMDTYSNGNNIYTLLTGLWPFYQYDMNDSEFVQDLLIHNKEKPYVDPRYRNRSVIEAGLVRIMEKSWEWDLDKRESIFEMLQQLYELKRRVSSSPPLDKTDS